jgi:hypothetical protein
MFYLDYDIEFAILVFVSERAISWGHLGRIFHFLSFRGDAILLKLLAPHTLYLSYTDRDLGALCLSLRYLI